MNFRKGRMHGRKNSMNVMMSSERWRQCGRRRSRRDTSVEEDSDEDDPEGTEIKDWAEEFFDRKSLYPEKSDHDCEVQLTKRQTLVLSTLVPDELLLMDKFDSANPRRFVGVLLMADVSGYTALTERYNNIAKGGAYRLTVTLNTYLGSLIELIYSHGGDIIKFAGDAFLALWKTDKKSFLYHTIHTVVTCALIIQHSYSSYETDVKVNLKVKLAISAGNLIFSPIGTGIDMNYIILGLPVLEAKVAESACASGEVKLTPTAWGHCYSRNYDYILHNDGHVTVKSILYDPREKDVTKPFTGFSNIIRQIKKPHVTMEKLPDFLFDSSNIPSNAEVQRKNEALSLRKTIIVAEEKNMGGQIRKFMIRPVLTQIDAHQPLEYLTEMRQVSVLFVTLKPRECPFPQLVTIVNNSYRITCEIVYKSMGCVNKIILFDKDVMILVIFGLRGFKHESEPQAALKCAYSIKKSVSALDGVLEVSIGVTTGQVYCGVVGHPLRKEFTVIGAIVNKAARLMCAFRNRITCDESTFIKSKMSKNGFTLQPKIELKGIATPGKIYEYTEEIRVKEIYNIPMILPLLNRTEELHYFQNWINDSRKARKIFDALLLVGESRIGKTRLLEWMARCARNNEYNVCYINLTSIHSASPYLALSQIINQMLGLTEPITGFAKEEKIIDLLKVYDEDLCYLNNIIKVRFAYHEGIYSQDEKKRKEKGIQIFTKLIKCIAEITTIFLDDLQNLDASSWEYISIMINVPKIFTILSITRGKFSSVHNWLYSVFINNNIQKIVLGSLISDWISSLACQILDVHAVPMDLCNALKLKCNGMPGLVESFLVHLFSSGALEIKKVLDTDIENWNNEELQFPDPALLRPQAVNIKDQEALNKLIDDDAIGEISICVVTRKEELNTNINVQNIDALIMMQIDSLTPYQQLLLKIASVIGNIVSRDLLENIMYENDSITTAKATEKLFAMRIFSCANIPTYKRRRSSVSAASSIHSVCYNLMCDCSFEYDPETSEGLPKYAYCKVMKFRNRNARKTCYELLPINQKKEFHSRIVNYLENTKQKCPDCGGKLMIVQSQLSLQSTCSDENSSYEMTEDNDEEYVVRTVNIEGLRGMYNIRQSKSESLTSSNRIEIMRTASDSKTNTYNIESIANYSRNNSQIAPILKYRLEPSDTSADRRSNKRVTMSNLYLRRISSDNLKGLKIFEKFRDVTECKNLNEWHNLGVIDSLDDLNVDDAAQHPFSIKIEKGVSETDFRKCTCADLNISICEQLIHHAEQAEMKIKRIEFMIAYSYLNILNDTVEFALPVLQDAEVACTDKELLDKSLLSDIDKRLFLARIHSLKAAAFLMSGNLSASKLEIERATKIYRINLHKVPDIFKFSSIFRSCNSKQYTRQKKKTLKSDSVFCLNTATLLYSTAGDNVTSRISALRALKSIQEVECNVIDLCDAFSNALQVELDRESPDNTANIEYLSRELLKKLHQPLQAFELFAVGKFFMATFRARLARGELGNAIHSGYRSIAISHFLQAETISIEIIPDLFYILLARCRILEAIDILKLALEIGQNQTSHDCETWYYALCMDMILDAGFQLESAYEISRFAEYALAKGRTGGGSRRRLVVNLWTYWLRADMDKKAKRFESEALGWTACDEDDNSLTTLLSALRLTEGMVESLVKKVDDLKKVVDLMELRSIADRELTRLENEARFLRSVYPRWLLLRANSLSISGKRAAANAAFIQGQNEARRLHNHLEAAMARAATINPVCWVQNASNGQFPLWMEVAEQVPSSWHELLYKININR